MRRRTPFMRIFTTLPRRSQLLLGTAVMGILTNYMGRKTIKGMEDVNLSINMEKILENPPDWSCFYYAKQYREECSEYNRIKGGEYIAEVCSNLEAKLRECKQKLARDIEECRPYAMDAPMRVTNGQPWLRKPDDNIKS